MMKTSFQNEYKKLTKNMKMFFILFVSVSLFWTAMSVFFNYQTVRSASTPIHLSQTQDLLQDHSFFLFDWRQSGWIKILVVFVSLGFLSYYFAILIRKIEKLANKEYQVARTQQIIQNLFQTTSNSLGNEFFARLTFELQKHLEVDYAVVAQLIVQGKVEKLRTIAINSQGKNLPNLEYNLQGTPCENVVGKQICYYPRNVLEKFPTDEVHKEMGISSYLGVPLFSSLGEPLGVLSVLSSGTIDDSQEAKDILSLFALRAAAEMERLKSIEEKNLNEHEKKQLEQQLYQSQKLEAMGTLTGGIAHDFNNLLLSMYGNIELLQMKLEPHHPSREIVQRLSQTTRRAKDLVQQLLRFSRRKEAKKAPVELYPILSEVTQLIRSVLPKNITIVFDHGDENPIIVADSSQIHQVFMNLCTNAAHAMEQSGGGGTLLIYSDMLQPSNELMNKFSSMKKNSTYIKVNVIDTGIGMNEETLRKIFDPFFTTKQEGHGTGLGLSVVKGILEKSDSFIDVVSKPGEGTTFIVYFPLHESKHQALTVSSETTPSPLPSSPSSHGNKEHILLVDDEEAIVMMCKDLLEHHDYVVHSFTEPTKALDYFKEHSQEISLLITDMTMPEISGDELCLACRKMKTDLPIVVMSGYHAKFDNLDFLNSAPFEKLPKPFDLRNFLATCGRMIQKKPTTQEPPAAS